jgi:hypothetical protein
MTRAVWMWTAATTVLLLAGWTAAVTSSHAPKLRSEHSLPAATAPSVVVVTEQGKLFHRADCAFIHGPARSEPGREVIAQGYTACPRCLKR